MNEFDIDPKTATILVVDDEAVNIKLLERILKTSGYTAVISTQDPRQVLALQQAHQCDLILLDINMPHMDGYAVMAQLKSEISEPLPPILVLTAQHMQQYRQQALDGGARDYVTKPFDSNELLSRVRNLLEVQLAHKYMRHHNEILEQKVKKRTKEIQEANERLNQSRLLIVRKLGKASEYRDEETGLHIIRMSKMSVLLGRAMGMDPYQSDLLLNAAPMHDVGKIGIPDNILLKPGKFEPEEWEIMKTHAQIGADILDGDESELLIMARDIALTHHEKWNGQGYPNGLKDKEIPLVGRICALADVFDALTSKRPYKKAWPTTEAVALIKEESGQHFDPELVVHFLALLPEFVAIKEKYAEPKDEQ